LVAGSCVWKATDLPTFSVQLKGIVTDALSLKIYSRDLLLISTAFEPKLDANYV